MGLFRGSRLRHRRDWRRLWLYCRCGFRWVCPDSVARKPMPYQPAPVPELSRAEFRRAVRAAQTEVAIVREAACQFHPDGPPPAEPGRPVNQRPVWTRYTGLVPRLNNGRAGNLTPAQEHRARAGERV